MSAVMACHAIKDDAAASSGLAGMTKVMNRQESLCNQGPLWERL